MKKKQGGSKRDVMEDDERDKLRKGREDWSLYELLPHQHLRVENKGGMEERKICYAVSQ